MKKLLLFGVVAAIAALHPFAEAAVVPLPASSTITADNTYTAATERGGSYSLSLKGTFAGATVALQYFNNAAQTWDTLQSWSAPVVGYIHVASNSTARLVVAGSTGTTSISAEIFSAAPLANISVSGVGPSYGSAGSPSASVGSVQGVSGGTPVPVTISGGGGTVPTGTAGSPNAAVVSMQGVSGGTAVPISGNVGITGTPSVSISGTPTVAVSGTVTTTISGTPSVSISGVTPSGGAIPVDGSAVAQPTVGYAANPTGTFNRPANITSYASGQLVANSTTAGSVVPVSLTAGRVTGGSFMIRRVKLHKSGTSTTNASFRIHFFRSAPTVSAGDGATNSMTGAANYLGAFDVVINQAFTDGSAGFGGPNSGQDVTVKLASGSTIYALIEALGAYSPVSSESITITLEDLQN